MTEPSLANRLAEALAAAGSTTMFGLPGGGPNLDVVGAALDHGLRFVLAHGETAAAIMASTHGSLTRTPSAVVVTRGPGAASVVNGLAQATLDRFPLVAITDTVPAVHTDRVPHQRIDQRSLLAPVSKSSVTLSPATTDGELVRLLASATEWPPGAVHLDYDASASATSADDGATPPTDDVPARVVTDQPLPLSAAWDLLDTANRPVVIVGMEAVVEAPTLGRLLTDFGAPVLTTYQAVGLIDSEHDVAAGLFTNGALERPVLDAADLIVTIGLDPVEPIPAPWILTCPVITISTKPSIADYLPADVELIGDLLTTADAILTSEHTWAERAGADFREGARSQLRPTPAGSFGPIELVDAAVANTPANATVTVDAGAHFLAVMPLWPVSAPQRLLISNGLATMGFALPAAIGAAIARPDEPVLALTGDGGLAMVLGELETVARLDLPITIVVFDDARLSLIEIKQRDGHGGPDAVRYRPVDHAAMAAAAGLDAHSVDTADELAAVLSSGWDRPRLVAARIDPTAYPWLIQATRG